MRKYFILLAVVVFAGIMPLSAAPIKIAAALPDLGSIASYIGGDKVDVFTIGRNNANPHAVEVLPSYMIKVSRAAIYLKVGLALDQWSDAIMDGSRNNKLMKVDCSNGVAVLQKPTGKVDASLGDVHPEGNPHYWLDPANGVIVAGNVLAALTKADPENGPYYEKNYERFRDETGKRMAGWKDALANVPGKRIIGYHSSWVYFASAFGLSVVGNVEPLPGIPPTAKHLAELVDMIKRDGIAVLLQEMYFPDNAPQFLARETGIKVYKFSPSCDNVKPDSYFRHFDEITGRIQGGK
ncbi:MAG: metal ABC transporter substrate-binding protein [Elusimicrobia bacterium]|nr:metal ABC transporter substrate-binding protein [Elusimicrobiota bacterium]